VVRAKLALGSLLDNRGAYREAIAIGNEAMRMPLTNGDYRLCLTLLADAHFHLGELSLAESLYQRALLVDRQLDDRSRAQVADDLMNLGNVQLSRGSYKQAERYFREALATNQSWFGSDSPQAADSASYVAQALYFQGGHETEEVSLLNYALQALEKAHGEKDIRVAFTLAQKGAVAIELKNLDEAVADFSQAAEIYRAIRGDEHQDVAIELANIASIYLAKKQYVRAEQSFRDVIRRFEKILPADNYNIGIARIKLGHCLLGEKRYRDSEAELLKGYGILAKQAGSSVSWLKTARKDLVTVYSALNQPEKGRRFQAELDRSEGKAKGSP